MANTLNLGNGNWGVKDSSLLGYKNRQNGRFLPETFDVARGSAGTRVNQSGLIESVTEILSADLVINGDFTTDTDWTLSSGITYNASKYLDFNLSSGQAKNTPNITFVQGKTYKVVYEIKNYVSGTIKFRFQNGTNTIGSAQSGDGVKTEFIICLDNSNNNFQFFGSSSFVGSIDNVSVVEVNRDNLARIDYLDDAAGVLLTEPQSTNLQPSSNDLTQSRAYTDATIVSNATTSPDGNINADKVVEGSLLSSHGLRDNPNIAATIAEDFTLSFFAKAGERHLISVSNAAESNTEATFNLTNGTITEEGASITAKMDDYGNGWYRCSISGNSNATISQMNIKIATVETGSVTYQGDGVSGLYVWGCQTESLGYPTSYIPTEGVAATRLADVVNNAGDVNNFNSEEGVLFAEISALANDLTNRYITISNGGDSYIRLTYTTTSNQLGARYYVNGTFQTALSHVLSDETEFIKVGFKWKENDFALWIDGVEVDTETNGSVNPPNTFDRLEFQRYGGLLPFYGKTKNIQVFDEALSDEELITLTTI